MKRIFMFLIALAMVLGFYVQTHASLIDRGADSLGYHLIYDSDLNITWYDYTKSSDIWQNQVSWAGGLTVNFNGSSLSGWRLPTVSNIGYFAYGYWDEGEMGHLYYTELGNQAGGPLSHTGPFTNLQPSIYWTGTTIYFINLAIIFDFANGYDSASYTWASSYSAFAVRAGDVPPVPEPSTMFLLGSGLIGLAGYGRKKLFKK